MIKRFAFAYLALLAFATAPALAQCCARAEKDKSGCSARQVEKCCSQDNAASKDGKACGSAAKACCASDKCDRAAACSGAGCGDITCAGELVRYKDLDLPRLGYQVDGKRIDCPRSAMETAKASNVSVNYLVADKVYADKSEAMKAYAVVLDEFADGTLEIKYAVGNKCTGCSKSAEAMAKDGCKQVRYRLASFDFADRASADKAAQMAREASEKIELTMVVGDETFVCPVGAAGAAEARGKEVEYCVGKTRTTCATTAKVRLALERIKVALSACESCGGKPIAGT